MKKRLLTTLLTCAAAVTLLVGCGSEAKNSTDNIYSGTLTLATWDNNLYTFIEQNDMIGKFQEHYPDVEI